MKTNYRVVEELVTLHDKNFKPLIPEQTLKLAVSEMAAQIKADYRGKCPVFISVLNGAFIFAADLIRAYGGACRCNFVRIASYSGMQSSGKVEITMPGELNLKGQDVIILEDIVDSGFTLHEYVPMIKAMQPQSVSVAALLVKTSALRYPLKIRYTGFEIEDTFVVGYGMDYDGLGRQLDGIYVLDEA